MTLQDAQVLVEVAKEDGLKEAHLPTLLQLVQQLELARHVKPQLVEQAAPVWAGEPDSACPLWPPPQEASNMHGVGWGGVGWGGVGWGGVGWGGVGWDPHGWAWGDQCGHSSWHSPCSIL